MKIRIFILGAAVGSVVLATLLAAAPVHDTENPLAGDWAGWAYFQNDQGDTPLRLRVLSVAGTRVLASTRTAVRRWP